MLRSVYLSVMLTLGPACIGQSSSADTRADDSYQIEQSQQWEEFDELIDHSKASMMAAPSDALEFARKAEAIARSQTTSTKSSTAIATSLWLQSEALIRVNQIDDIQPLLDRALAAIDEEKSNSKLAGDLLLARGRVGRLTGNMETALDSFHKAHKIFEELEISRSQSIALQSIGSIYNDAHSFERALEYYERADEVYSDDPSLDIASANNRANTLKELGRFEESFEQFNRALAISSSIHSPLLEARILTNLASLQILVGDLEAANLIADDALVLLRENDDNNWSSFVWGIKAEVALHNKNIVEASSHISSVFTGMDLTQTSTPFRDMHEIAYEIFSSTGEKELAMQHLEAFKRLDDHGRDLSASANMALMGAQFDFANQELQIQQLKTGQLERDMNLVEARAKQQRLSLYAALLLSLVITTSLTVLYASMRRHRNEVNATNLNLQEMVSRLNVEIERRHEVEADLRQAKEQAESANHAKSQFLANMSHELRTPLNAIIGFAEIIANEIMGPNGKPEYRDYARDINDSGRHLLTILNDVLDMSRIDAGKMILDESELDIHGLIEESLREIEEEAASGEITLTKSQDDPDLTIKADERMMHQILAHLLSNALKFTDRKGLVEVNVEMSGDGSIVLVVQDDGIGIPHDKLEAILEPFGQVEDSYSRSQGGVGLGLPIVRSLIEIHGGHLKIESAPGEGTRVCVEIPGSRVIRQAA